MFLIKHKGCRAKDQTVENQRIEDERTGFRINYWFVDEGAAKFKHRCDTSSGSCFARAIGGGYSIQIS